MRKLFCAVCGKFCINPIHVNPNTKDEYALCYDCWINERDY